MKNVKDAVNNMEYKAPRRNTIIARRFPRKKKQGSLFLPETQTYRNPKCEVLSVASYSRKLKNGTIVPMELRPGDVVHILSYDSPEKITTENEAETFHVNADLVWFKYPEHTNVGHVAQFPCPDCSLPGIID